MSVLEKPHYVIKSAELAKWLTRMNICWWIVHGDCASWESLISLS